MDLEEHFARPGAFGWIVPGPRVLAAPPHGHIEAVKADPGAVSALPAGFDWNRDPGEVMDSLYAAGFGRLGTWDAQWAPGGRGIELECYVEHVQDLEEKAQEIAEAAGRHLQVSPVFTREYALAAAAAYPARPKPALSSVASGHAVCWVPPGGKASFASPARPLGFLDSDTLPGLSSVRRRWREIQRQFAERQSSDWLEGYEPEDDGHVEWHRFHEAPYVCPEPVAAMFRTMILKRGWAFAEPDGRGAARIHADSERGAPAREWLEGLFREEGIPVVQEGADMPGLPSP